MMENLGQYAVGAFEWAKILASVPEREAKLKVFSNAAQEFASYVSRGLDRVAAADALQEMATNHGNFGEEQDTIQEIIGRALEQAERVPDDIGIVDLGERRRSQKEKANGHDISYLPLTQPFPLYGHELPPRDWAVPHLFLRRHLTVLVAPSGTGKSLLTLQLGIACAQYKEWAKWRPRKALRVLFINSEDDLDEIRRRLAAAAYKMGINRETQEEISNRFFIAESPVPVSKPGVKAEPPGIVVARFDARSKTMIASPLHEQLIATVLANEIDVIFVDPFAETFEGDENSNSELKWAGMLWREVARRTNAAVCLVHHTKKYATGMAGDVDAARGAGALIGIARIVSTLFPMSVKEAEVMGISSDQRGFYLRYDDAKANLNMISPYARWFRKDNVPLGNALKDDDGIEIVPQDEVGVLIPWESKKPVLLEEQIIKFFERVDIGILKDDETPSGEFYTFEKGGRGNDRQIAPFAKEFFNLETMAQAEEYIQIWRKKKRLRQIEYKSPKTRKLRQRVVSELGNGSKNGNGNAAQTESQFDFAPPPRSSFKIVAPSIEPCALCSRRENVFLIRDPFRGVASHPLHEGCAAEFFGRDK